MNTQAQKNGTIKSNLKGVALGDAWISPIDSTLTWASYLLATVPFYDSVLLFFISITKHCYIKYELLLRAWWTQLATKKSIDQHRGRRTLQRGETGGRQPLCGVTRRGWSPESLITSIFITFWQKCAQADVTLSYRFRGSLNLKEVLHKLMTYSFSFVSDSHRKISVTPLLSEEDTLTNLMNGPVRSALGLAVVHGRQSNQVWNNLQGDFMKPVVNIGIYLNENRIILLKKYRNFVLLITLFNQWNNCWIKQAWMWSCSLASWTSSLTLQVKSTFSKSQLSKVSRFFLSQNLLDILYSLLAIQTL